jgi:hypothetical protein
LLAEGARIAEFSAQKCTAITGDTLRTDDAGRVQWENGAEISALRGKRIQLRFVLQNARLFSFRFAARPAENPNPSQCGATWGGAGENKGLRVN